MKAIIAIMTKLSHLFDDFQFMGLSGSSSPSQLITLELGFSTLPFESPLSSSVCFTPAVIVGDASAAGKAATAAFEVDICVFTVMDEPQMNE